MLLRKTTFDVKRSSFGCWHNCYASINMRKYIASKGGMALLALYKSDGKDIWLKSKS